MSNAGKGTYRQAARRAPREERRSEAESHCSNHKIQFPIGTARRWLSPACCHLIPSQKNNLRHKSHSKTRLRIPLQPTPQTLHSGKASKASRQVKAENIQTDIATTLQLLRPHTLISSPPHSTVTILQRRNQANSPYISQCTGAHKNQTLQPWC